MRLPFFYNFLPKCVEKKIDSAYWYNGKFSELNKHCEETELHDEIYFYIHYT